MYLAPCDELPAHTYANIIPPDAIPSGELFVAPTYSIFLSQNCKVMGSKKSKTVDLGNVFEPPPLPGQAGDEESFTRQRSRSTTRPELVARLR